MKGFYSTIGGYLRLYAPSLWSIKIMNGTVFILMLGVVSIISRYMFPAAFLELASTFFSMAISLFVFLLYVDPLFEIDGVNHSSTKNYFLKLLWGVMSMSLIIFSFFSVSVDFGISCLFAIISLICIFSCRFEVVLYFYIFAATFILPMLIIVGAFYYVFQAFNVEGDVFKSVLAGFIVNAIVFWFKIVSWIKDKDRLISIGVSMLHMPLTFSAGYFAIAFADPESKVTSVGEDLFAAFASVLLTPVLILVSDWLTSRPGSYIKSGPWRQI